MTALFAIVTVVSWGTWIPVAQVMPGVSQRSRTFHATVGNVVFATVFLLVAGGHVTLGWRSFWLPFAGGLVWTAGNYSAFRASATIGLARAAGSWTPLNIIVAFVWGAAIFGELHGFGGARAAELAGALVLVFVGVLLILRSQDTGRSPAAALLADAGGSSRPVVAGAPERGAPEPGLRALPIGAAVRPSARRGVFWAVAAGVLWGSYFVPAQWAKVSAQVSNFPLALGILVAGVALVIAGREPVRLLPRPTAVQLAAGVLFGIGNLTLLRLVARVGTGVGFTIAQLSLLVNATVGVFVFKVPPPRSRSARLVLAGVLVAGLGGVAIGSMR